MKMNQFVKLSISLSVALVLVACGGAAPTNESTSSSSAAAITTPSSSIAPTTSASSKSASADTQAPSMPASLMLGSTPTTNSVTISWSQASDNVAVTSYQIYRDSQLISTTPASTQTMIDGSVAANRSYVYGVKAGDAAGNWSAMKTLTVTTPPPVAVVPNSSAGIQASSLASSSRASSMAASVVASSQSSSPSSRASSSSSRASSSSSRTSSASSSTQATHSTSLGWAIPTLRENGDPLPTSEIGGYSIRFTSTTSGAVSTQNVPGGRSESATVNNLVGTYTFEIATYDTAGLYSDYALIGVK